LVLVNSDPMKKKKTPIIYVAFSGVVDSETERWVAGDERYQAEFLNQHRSGDLDVHRRMIAAADIVEIASEDADWLYKFLPSTPLQKDLLKVMRNDPSFTELTPVSGLDGKVYLFVRLQSFDVFALVWKDFRICPVRTR
jgi:hypothetical protein